jgi:hypothetical protein
MQRSEMVRNFIPLVLLFLMAFCSGISILELGRTTYHQFTFLNAIIGAHLGLNVMFVLAELKTIPSDRLLCLFLSAAVEH